MTIRRDPPPRRGVVDTRPAEEVADNADRIMTDDSFLPTVEDMRAASGVPWGDDEGYDPDHPARARVVAVDRGGVIRRELGGLAFIAGSFLLEYRTSPDGSWKRPAVVSAAHRNRRVSAPRSPVVRDWSLDDVISARQELAHPRQDPSLVGPAAGTSLRSNTGARDRRGVPATRQDRRAVRRAADRPRHRAPAKPGVLNRPSRTNRWAAPQHQFKARPTAALRSPSRRARRRSDAPAPLGQRGTGIFARRRFGTHTWSPTIDLAQLLAAGSV